MRTQTAAIDIPTADGVADAIHITPVEGGPHPGELVYMDAFGLRPRLEEMAGQLAGRGYAVLVPNVFYRSGLSAHAAQCHRYGVTGTASQARQPCRPGASAPGRGWQGSPTATGRAPA